MELTAGANAPIDTDRFSLTFSELGSMDVSIFMLDSNGKVLGDAGMVFYGQPKTPEGSVSINGQKIDFDLSCMPASIEKVAITGTLDSGNFSQKPLFKLFNDQYTLSFSPEGRTEAALIFAEIYRRNNQWKIRCVSQGFNGGLKPLAESFGVQVESPPASEPASNNTQTSTNIQTPSKPEDAPATDKRLNLSKINLTKQSPKINLDKAAGALGDIKANLNWIKGKTGFFSKGIDLDLGAYVEFVNGDKTIIQALGNRFREGDYIQLLGDDRTGTSTDGESILVNGRKLNDVKRIMFYAFIYEGVSSWDKAQGIFTLHVPGMPPIETHLTDGVANKSFCCVAALNVKAGRVEAERINEYFQGHKDCDSAFGWNLEWTKGSK